jgi:hypothetical protein
MTVTMKSVGVRLKTCWTWICRASSATWQWVHRQWDAMRHSAAGEISPRQARRAEKMRRKEIRRHLKEKALRKAA